MRKITLTLTAIILLSACQVFLGPQPDSSPKGIFDRIWTDFNETYALFEARGIDWDKTYEEYSPKISNDMGEYELFRICAEMLNSLKDPHVYLITPFGYSYFLHYKDNDLDYEDIYWEERELLVPETVRSYLKDEGTVAGQGRFLYGRFKNKPNIGYIYIMDFRDFKIALDPIPNWVKEINGIVESLQDTDTLILDVRNSWGGLGSNMDYIAGRFASVPADYIKFCTKNGPGRNDFSDPINWAIKPAGPSYIKPIALLTNKKTISASEWFVMAMKTQSHVTHVGEKTWGAFSARIMRTLVNGWEYTISIQKVTDMDGNCYEGKGISPNEEHKVDKDIWNDLFYKRDSQLEYALSMF